MTLSEFKDLISYSIELAKCNQNAVELLTKWDGISHVTVEECGTNCTPEDVLDILHSMPVYSPFITRNGDFIKVPGVSVRCGSDCDSVFYIAINLSNTRCSESK